MGRKANKEAPKEGKITVELVGDWFFCDLGKPRERGLYRRVVVPAGTYILHPELIDKRCWLLVERLEGDSRRYGISYEAYVQARGNYSASKADHRIVEKQATKTDTHEKNSANTEAPPALTLSQAT